METSSTTCLSRYGESCSLMISGPKEKTMQFILADTGRSGNSARNPLHNSSFLGGQICHFPPESFFVKIFYF